MLGFAALTPTYVLPVMGGVRYISKEMTFSRQDWVASKKDTALRLVRGECGGSYAEGVIIMSATISAMAARRLG